MRNPHTTDPIGGEENWEKEILLLSSGPEYYIADTIRGEDFRILVDFIRSVESAAYTRGYEEGRDKGYEIASGERHYE